MILEICPKQIEEVMQKNLTQNRAFKMRRYTLTETGLHIKVKDFVSTHEYEVLFENVGNKLMESKRGNRKWLVPGIILLFISGVLLIDRLNGGDVETGAEIFYLIPGLVCIAGYIITYQRSYYLTNSNNQSAIEFMIGKPSDKELSDFLNHVKIRRNEYLLNKYGQLNKNLSYESQYNNLLWLSENGVIDGNDLKKKFAELEFLFPPATKVSGFAFSTNSINN